jgi:hypothetical protein
LVRNRFEIPERVYDSLRLNEGESIRITIIPAKKHLSKEEKLKLIEQTQGIWADDEKIDEALAYLGRDRGKNGTKNID